MSESLVSKFKDMSDREILIATCLKVEGLECRIDKHSVERDEDKRSFEKRFVETENRIDPLESRVSLIETEKSSRRSLMLDAGGVVGLIGGGFALWEKVKEHFL